MLRRVRIPSPEQRFDDYPHKLSGGMRQRAMIAMALACDPQLLIADEPTTALDVTIQAQILDLMRGLRRETGTAIILITHDLGVVAEMADDVAVMYAGQIVERAPVEALFARPEHPYTVGPAGLDPQARPQARAPALDRGPRARHGAAARGCRFAARCPFVEPACRAAPPPLVEVAPGHLGALPPRAARSQDVHSSRHDAHAVCSTCSSGLVKHFPVKSGAFGRVARPRARGRRRRLPCQAQARRWRSSANRAAASRRSAAWCCA